MKRFVQQVLDSHGEKSETFGQAIADGRVEDPELIVPVEKGSARVIVGELEPAILMIVGRLQETAYSGGVEETDPQGEPVGLSMGNVGNKPVFLDLTSCFFTFFFAAKSLPDSSSTVIIASATLFRS